MRKIFILGFILIFMFSLVPVNPTFSGEQESGLKIYLVCSISTEITPNTPKVSVSMLNSTNNTIMFDEMRIRFKKSNKHIVTYTNTLFHGGKTVISDVYLPGDSNPPEKGLSDTNWILRGAGSRVYAYTFFMPELINYNIESFSGMTANVQVFFKNQKLFEKTDLKILISK